MEMRARLLKGATALLYFGPLLAGMGGYGWSMVPAFVAIFVLNQIIQRPELWLHSWADFKKWDLWVSLGTQVMVQILLVAVSFGIGRGIGGAAGTLPVYSPYLPLAVSFLSIPLARMLWDPWKGDSFEAIEDAKLAAAAVVSDPETEAAEAAARVLQPLQDMAGRTTEAEVLRHLKAMAKHVPMAHLLDALVARNGGPDASHGIQMALVVLVTDPELMDTLNEGAPSLAVQVLPDDPALVTVFATRLAAAVSKDADLAASIPTEAVLTQRADRIGGAAAQALMALVPLRNPGAAHAA
jgi:hypothetical protein